MDVREVELPETAFIRDIETRVFQGIIVQTLSKVEGIGLLGGNLLESWFGREAESTKGIHVTQNGKNHSVDIRVEVHIAYGVSIPEKSEEIQSLLAREVSRWTGLHVASVHVIFKDLLQEAKGKKIAPEFAASPQESLEEGL